MCCLFSAFLLLCLFLTIITPTASSEVLGTQPAFIKKKQANLCINHFGCNSISAVNQTNGEESEEEKKNHLKPASKC